MIATAEINVPTVACRSREEWLAVRERLIGASDTAGIFGVGYADQSPLTVWDSKVNPSSGDDPVKAKRFRIGKLMEPSLRLIFEEETGLPCHAAGEFTIYRHPEIQYLGCTLDATTVHDDYGTCPVELKNVSNFARAGWEDGEAPLKFNVQVQHQLAVTGATHAFLLGLVGGNEPLIRVIPRNDRFIDAMIRKLDEFWSYVVSRELPPVDESAATAKLLAKLWPEDNGLTVDLPAEADEWATALAKAKADAADAKDRETQYSNYIKAAMGEASFAMTPGGRKFSWKQQTRKGYYVEETSFRVLRTCK